MPKTKEEKAAYMKQYNIDNRERAKQWEKDNAAKRAAGKKQWRVDNADKCKEHDTQYRVDNAEKIKQYRVDNAEGKKEYDKQYKIENREKRATDAKQYYIDNAEMMKEKKTQYQIDNPEKCKKIRVISGWKRIGIIGDLSFIYDNDYLPATNCWVCNKVFENSFDKCCDHDHSITDGDNVRQIVCRSCNSMDSWKNHSEWV